MGSERTVDHLIVGAGFAGPCAAIKLAEDGEIDCSTADFRRRLASFDAEAYQEVAPGKVAQ